MQYYLHESKSYIYLLIHYTHRLQLSFLTFLKGGLIIAAMISLPSAWQRPGKRAIEATRRLSQWHLSLSKLICCCYLSFSSFLLLTNLFIKYIYIYILNILYLVWFQIVIWTTNSIQKWMRVFGQCRSCGGKNGPTHI